jgi:hypothetical protein
LKLNQKIQRKRHQRICDNTFFALDITTTIATSEDIKTVDYLYGEDGKDFFVLQNLKKSGIICYS